MDRQSKDYAGSFNKRATRAPTIELLRLPPPRAAATTRDLVQAEDAIHHPRVSLHIYRALQRSYISSHQVFYKAQRMRRARAERGARKRDLRHYSRENEIEAIETARVPIARHTFADLKMYHGENEFLIKPHHGL